MTDPNDEARPQPGRFSRRSLIASSAGAATTVAVVAVGPAAAVAMGAPEAPLHPVARPSTPMPADPVVAYVHDAARGEVTVLAGTEERTYRDPILVKRLLAAAHRQSPTSKGAK